MKRLVAPMVALLLITLLICSCVSPRNIRKEFEPYRLCTGGKYQVVVAAEDTPWKQEVINKVTVNLGEEYCITVKNLAALSQVSIEEWDVVVVLSAIYAFGLQSDTDAFIKQTERKDRVVLLITSSISDLKEYGADAVSAASTGNVGEDARSLTPKRQPDDVAAELAGLIRSKVE